MNLNANQIEAIDCLEQNLRIVACAGSGKTEVITRRIANIFIKKKDVLPKNIVAFTFTNNAADNMRDRINQNIAEAGLDIDLSEMYVGTIHSFCKRLLDQYVPKFNGFNTLNTIEEHMLIMKSFSQTGADKLGLSRHQFSTFSTCFDKMVDSFETIDQWPEKDVTAFNKYRDLLYKNHFMNFPLMIYEVISHLDDPGVHERFNEIKYLVVDEYQDIDDLQEKLIRKISMCGANVCIVGDDDQTIYQFRGSNANNLIDFAKKYENVTTINLNTNYRSGKEIIKVADSVIAHNKKRLSKGMEASDTALAGCVKAVKFNGIAKEFDCLCDDIKSLKGKVEYKDMAILLRNRKHILALTRALDQAGIPYKADVSDKFFESDYYDKFRNIFKYLGSSDDVNKRKVREDWEACSTPQNISKAIRYLSRCNENNEGFETILYAFLNYLSVDEDPIVKEYVNAFATILQDFEKVYKKDSWSVKIYDLNYYLEKNVESEYKNVPIMKYDMPEEVNPDNVIQIMSIHRAKGMQFEAVFIPEIKKGFLPDIKERKNQYYSYLGGIFVQQRSKYMNDIEDERKLFYVALTRAKQYLYTYSSSNKKTESPFLDEVMEAL